MTRPLRPALRPIETIVVPDQRYGRILLLRDTQGVTDAHAAVPPPLVPIVARFTGDRTCEEIAKDAEREMGTPVPVEVVERLANELDKGLFLEGPTFEAARARVHRAFSDSKVRPASHAGGAYLADARELADYLERKCIGQAKKNGAKPRAKNGTSLVALVAPHIDPWRGAACYGHAYGAMAEAIGDDVDTFVVFGTSHAPMREHFALCNKAFDTPLGKVEADGEALEAIAKKTPFDPYRDEFNHKREHSLEFQVVFLRHLFGKRPIRIVPVLAGLGEHQARRSDPAKDERANRFLDAVREVVESRAGRVALVAGADMAHVGPRFGDPQPYRAAERAQLEKTDRGSLEIAAAGDAAAFWQDVSHDLDTRRVCGLAPIYALLRTMPGGAKGELLHYEQTVDAEDGSIVSHAAVGFYG